MYFQLPKIAKYFYDTLKIFVNDILPLIGNYYMIPKIIVVSLRSQMLQDFLKETFTYSKLHDEILRSAGNKMFDFVKDTSQA